MLVTASDDLVYEYEVTKVLVFPRESTVIEVFGQAPPDEHRLTLFTNATYDPAAARYTDILAVRTTWSPENQPEAAGAEDLIATGQEICPALDALPQKPLFANTRAMEMPLATASEPATVKAINQALGALPGCEFGVKVALTLPNGNVMALVGPGGSVSLQDLTGAVGVATLTVTDQQKASLFALVLFLHEADSWAPYSPPVP